MSVRFEELRVLQLAESIADGLWKVVVQWERFAKDSVGLQLVRAADSIGANIAEAYGRYHYGEKLQFLYYARGSLFETKYWLNRGQSRQLISTDQYQEFATTLSGLAHQLNTFARATKAQRTPDKQTAKRGREPSTVYDTVYDPILQESLLVDNLDDLFTLEEIESFALQLPNYPIT